MITIISYKLLSGLNLLGIQDSIVRSYKPSYPLALGILNVHRNVMDLLLLGKSGSCMHKSHQPLSFRPRMQVFFFIKTLAAMEP